MKQIEQNQHCSFNRRDVKKYSQIISSNKISSIKPSDRGSVDQISVDQNCVLSLDQNYVNHLIKFFDTFHLIELFDQLIKKN